MATDANGNPIPDDPNDPNAGQPDSVPTFRTQARAPFPSTRVMPSLGLPAAAAPPTTSPSDLGQAAPSAVPKFLFPYVRGPLGLTQSTAPASTPEEARAQTPSYLQSSVDPSTGMPSAGSPNLTKLGKVLTILRGAGLGAAVGSTQPTFGRGFMAANQFENQQAAQNQAIQEGGLNLQIARQKIAMLPLEQQKTQLEIQNQQLALQGLHTVYRQENDGSFTEQMYDRSGNPYGNPITHTISPQAMAYAYKPHLQLVPKKDGTYVNYNKLSGKFEDLDGTVLPDDQQRELQKYVAPSKPGTSASLVGAQIGEEPTSNVYQGVTYPTVADAKAAWGRAGQGVALQGKAAPEIAAQLGPTPTTAQYRGKTFPTPEAAKAAWGRDYQQIKTQEAMAIASARGQAMGYYRPYNALDADGNIRPMFFGEARAQGVAPAELGSKIMSKTAQFNDIDFASQQVRNALTNLDAKFSPTQVALLTEALNERDPTIKQNEINALISQNLTQAQRDFVVWAPQLTERAMSIRSLAGMGQGAQDLRNAVMNTLPSVRDGDRALALQKLDAFDNLTNNLRAGIPHVKAQPKAGGAGGGTPGGGAGGGGTPQGKYPKGFKPG